CADSRLAATVLSCDAALKGLLRLRRLVGELLARNGGLEHRAAFHDREHREPLVILAHGGRILPPAARTSIGTRRADLRACSRGDRNGTDIRTHLEVAARELLERPLILEKDDLAVRLSAGLQPHTHLRDRAVANVLAVLVHTPAAMRSTHHEAALAHCRKHG